MKMQRSFLFFLLICLIQFGLNAQEERLRINSGKIISFDFTYGFHLPGGDLNDRFGRNNDIGGALSFMTDKGNWIFGIRGGYLFGKFVDEDVLEGFRTASGNIIGSSSTFANVALLERGIYSNIEFGKLIGLVPGNPRSGLRVTLGMGFLQHKIRFEEDRSSFVPQIINDYAKGYDRLSNGFAVTEFIGYQHMAVNRLVNFYVGFEFVQAFTQNRRDWDFLLERKDETKRKDFLSGFKVGWILPFYISPESSESIRY